MSEKHLLAEVTAHPWDDAPRLVYADWLEEHGDETQQARAEFIRLQIEHARLGLEDPRRLELGERERSLLAQHGKAWRLELPTWTLKEGVCFRRGFVTEVNATARQFLRGAAGLRKVTPLEGVGLRAADGLLGEVAPLLAGLRTLALNDLVLKDEDASLLATSPALADLRWLELGSYSGTSAVSVAGLQTLVGASSLGPLEELHVSYGTANASLAVQALPTSRHGPHLTSLSLRGGERNRPVLLSALNSTLAALPRLKSLYLYCVIGAMEAIAALAELPAAAGLRSLAICIDDLTDSALETAFHSPHLRGLGNLALTHTSLGDDGAARLANAPSLVGLHTLTLDYNNIGDAGVEALVNSPHLAGLRSLSFYGNPTGEAGARAVARSPYLSQVRYLQLGNRPISETTLAEVRERFGPTAGDINASVRLFSLGLLDLAWGDRRGLQSWRLR